MRGDVLPRRKSTTTSSFGTSRREGHNADPYYRRRLNEEGLPALDLVGLGPADSASPVPQSDESLWADRIHTADAKRMPEVPDGSIGLAFTSPPYNAGKGFDEDLGLVDYLTLIRQVAQEVHRVLVPGGRYVVNVANLGRKPYIPLTAYFYAVHMGVGFLPMGEVVWRKGRGMNANCAWGSWRSAKAPRLRDIHEMLLVFAKASYGRPDKGKSDMTAEAFMDATLSVWEIPPESARRVGHPAPFPLTLADRVIRLYSFVDDVVLDPFAGSGTTCLAARLSGRHYVGYEIDPAYAALARRRIEAVRGEAPVSREAERSEP